MPHIHEHSLPDTGRPELVDPFGRRIEYLRLSLTDRCDLRCGYCLPKGFRDFEPDAHWLRAEEIEQLVRVLAGLGVHRIRLTGGEPLTRRDTPEIAARLACIEAVEDLSLSTNATRLERLAPSLHEAGIRRLNISLDTLDATRFRELTGGLLHKVLRGIDAAVLAGFSPIKINMVVMRGVNDGEIPDMIEFCAQRGLVLRLIETMPMGSTGQNASRQYADLTEIRSGLEQRYTLVPCHVDGGGPARNYMIAENGLNIGFITPISQHFCASCNRVRLTADGQMHMCLGQEHRYDFAPLLRGGIDDQTLVDHILAAIALKPERHEFRERPEQVLRFMSQTGG